MEQVEYLNILFEGPPTGQQLTEQFGKDGWVLRFMLPMMVPDADNPDAEPTQKLGAYFTRPKSLIHIPSGAGFNEVP